MHTGEYKYMKITVVTVCFNAQKTIDLTINSVLNQTYQEIEYLIIDGKSNDGTLDIINKYADDKRIRLLSESDRGLYNAMNKAIILSTGKYVIFMNSGDVFYDDRVLEDMIPHLQFDLVYGNVIRKKQKGDILEKYHGKHKIICLLLMGRMMCHQALFTKTDIMKEYRFDERIKICADYDFVMRAKKNKCSMKYVDRTICVVDNVEGISSQLDNYEIMRKEDDRSLKENFLFYYYIVKIPKGIVRFFRRICEKYIISKKCKNGKTER